MAALRNPHPKRLKPAGALYPQAEFVMRKRREISPSLQPVLDSCWLAAPSERSPLFFPAFAAISLAIQGALRERVPAACLVNPNDFEDTRTAYPILVYQASRTFHGKGRADLTYDVLDEILMKRFYRRAKKGLVSVLAGVVARLHSEQREDLVRLYQPNRAEQIVAAVQKARKSRAIVFDLLVGECALVNELRQLAGLGDMPVRERAKRATNVSKSWNSHLRGLCPGRDFRCLAPELLKIAAAALVHALTQRNGPETPEPNGGPLLHEPNAA